MKIGVFLEAPRSLEAQIQSWKARVLKSFPGAALANHPVHCTLIAAPTTSPESALRILQEHVGEMSEATCRTESRLHVFENDAGTNGGNTMVVTLGTCSKVFELQRLIANLLLPIIDAGSARAAAGSIREKQLRESAEKFGYAFVGDHWIPHFTIASPVASMSAPLFAAAQSEDWGHDVTVRAIGVWEIEGDRHNCLGRIEF